MVATGVDSHCDSEWTAERSSVDGGQHSFCICSGAGTRGKATSLRATKRFMASVPHTLICWKPSVVPLDNRIATKARHIELRSAGSISKGALAIEDWVAYCASHTIVMYGVGSGPDGTIDSELILDFLTEGGVAADKAAESAGLTKRLTRLGNTAERVRYAGAPTTLDCLSRVPHLVTSANRRRPPGLPSLRGPRCGASGPACAFCVSQSGMRAGTNTW